MERVEISSFDFLNTINFTLFGVLTFVTIFLLYPFNHYSINYYKFTISALALLLLDGFITLPIFNIVIIFFIVYVIYLKKEILISDFKYYALRTILFISFFLLFFLTITNEIHNVLTFVGLGYDNVQHFALFDYFLKNKLFYFLTSPNFEALPASFFNPYPGLTAKTMSAISSIINPFHYSINLSISTYFTTMIILFISFLITSSEIIKKYTQQRIQGLVIYLIVFTIFFVSDFSHIWISGYPTFYLGLIILNIHFLLISSNFKQNSIFYLFAPPIILLNIYSPFALIALSLSLHKFFKQFRHLINLSNDKINSFVNVFIILILLFLTWLSTLPTIAGFGLKQFINPFGGIEKISYQTVLIISFITLLILLYNYPKWEFLHTIYIASLLAYCILLGANMYFNSEEGYYTFKQSYHLLFLCLIVNVISFAKLINKHPKLFTVIILSISLSTSLLRSNEIFRTAYMGDTMSVLRVFLNSKERHNQNVIGMQIIKSKVIMDGLNSNLGIMLTTTRSTVLNSLWLNAVAGSWSDIAWSTFQNIGTDISNENIALLLDVSSNFENPVLFLTDVNLSTVTRKELESRGWKLIDAPG
jgi:hypothetical protein